MVIKYCFLCTLVEFGIYCELNLANCVTYVVSPGRTVDSVEPFKVALNAFFEQLTYPTNMDSIVSEAKEVKGPPVQQQQHICMNSIGYVHSSGMLLLTERLPLPILFEGGDIHSSISSSPIVGRIAAETVRTVSLLFVVMRVCFNGYSLRIIGGSVSSGYPSSYSR